MTPNVLRFVSFVLKSVTILLATILFLSDSAQAAKPGGGGGSAAPTYTYRALGQRIAGMNNHGDVVGDRLVTFYGASAPISVDDLVDPTLVWDGTSGWYIDINDINDAGQICGSAGYYVQGPDPEQSPTLLDACAIRLDPPQIAGDYYAFNTLPGSDTGGRSINNSSDIAGQVWLDGRFRAAVWVHNADDSYTYDVLPATVPGIAIGLNNRDVNGTFQIIGQDYATGRGWRCNYNIVSGMSGFTLLLGTSTKDQRSDIRDLNDVGDVVGMAYFGARSDSLAARFTGTGVQSLGSLARNSSMAAATNNSRVVVGVSAYGQWPNYRAFYYKDDVGMVQLDNRISGLPANLVGKVRPVAVNDSGVIACTDDRSEVGFLLIPN
jgi:hypothetical protein